MQKRLSAISSYLRILITTALGFYLMLVTTKFAGQEIYGIFIILKSTSGFIGNLLSMRSGEAVTKFCKENEVRDNLSLAKNAIFLGLVSDLIVSTLIILSVILLSEWIAVVFLHDVGLSHLVTLFGMTSFFAYLRGSFIGYLQVRDKYLSINSIVSFEAILIIISLTVNVIFFDAINLEFLVWTHVIVYGVITVLFLISFMRDYKKRYSGIAISFDKEFLNDYLKFTLKTFTSSLLKAGNKNVDNLVIALALSTSDVGYYQAIKKCFSLMEVIAQPWTMLSYSKLISYYTKSDITLFRQYLANKSLIIVSVSLFTGLLSIFFIDLALGVLSIDLREGDNGIVWLLMLGFVIASSVWWGRVFSNVVNPNISIYINLVSLLYNVSMLYLLVSYYGVYGAALSFLILNLIIAVFFFYHYSQLKDRSVTLPIKNDC